jgi:flagellar operon protein (TIGR03826 family)
MGQLANCSQCGGLYVTNAFRNICEACYRKEETLFQTVYEYIRKRENRTATLIHVVRATGVEENLIYKFIKQGRLHLAHFPNLGYPCEQCGALIREGRICVECRDELKKELNTIKEIEEHQRQAQTKTPERATYHAINKDFLK